MTARITPASLPDLLGWLDAAPEGTLLPAATLRAWVAPLADASRPTPAASSISGTWRERLWTAAPDTRMGVLEVADAIGRPKSWVYRRTGEGAARARLPHRKLDGELVFTAGEVRAWLEQHEVVVARPVRWPGAPALAVSKGGA